jgi:hypothetical protein
MKKNAYSIILPYKENALSATICDVAKEGSS